MNIDTVVQALRYAILIGGGVVVGLGWATKEQLTTLSNALPEVIAAIVTAATALWGFYVKWNTKSVPTVIAEKPSVPVVSTVTGQIVEEGKK